MEFVNTSAAERLGPPAPLQPRYDTLRCVLRAIPADPAEPIVGVSERSRVLAGDARRQRISHADGPVVHAVRHENRAANLVRGQDGSERAIMTPVEFRREPVV